MNILTITLFLISISINPEHQETINLIDKYGKLIKEKKETNKEGDFITKKYKYENYIKKEFFYKTFPRFFGDGFFKFYAKNGFVFCRINNYNSLYIQKGARNEETPYGEIVESDTYFESETKGIQLRRILYYKENQKDKIDSLTLVLKKMVFDTTEVGEFEYKQVKSGYKNTSI
jgi:hypothetical protein